MLDAHFHLNYLPLATRSALLDDALARGVYGGLVAGVWTDDTVQLAAWAQRPASVSPVLTFLRRGESFTALNPSAQKNAQEIKQGNVVANALRFQVVCAHGLHPEALATRLSAVAADMRTPLLAAAIVVFDALLEEHGDLIHAIGETGFDAHPHVLKQANLLGLGKEALLAFQNTAFDACVAASVRRGLPLIVHSRGAWEHTLRRITDALRAGVPRIMIHCYGGPAVDVARLADKGVFLSFGGVPTWAKAHRVKDAFLACPMANLLLETDAPDLPYEREDGSRPAHHEPAHLAELATRLAGFRAIDVESFERSADENLRRFLGMKS